MKKNVLILGANGFIGNILNRNFIGNFKVIPVIRRKKKNYVYLDFKNFDESFFKIIKKYKPSFIINCIGSYENDLNIDIYNNCAISELILNFIIKKKIKTKIILIGSASEYGTKLSSYFAKENDVLRGKTKYSISKIAQYNIFNIYKNNKNLNVIYLRLFNINSNNSPQKLFIGNLNKQIREFKKKKIKKIILKNINSFRDFIEIPNLTFQINLILNYGKSGEVYNIGTGIETEIKTILKEKLTKNNIDMKHVLFNNNFRRDYLVANTDKVKALELKSNEKTSNYS